MHQNAKSTYFPIAITIDSNASVPITFLKDIKIHRIDCLLQNTEPTYIAWHLQRKPYSVITADGGFNYIKGLMLFDNLIIPNLEYQSLIIGTGTQNRNICSMDNLNWRFNENDQLFFQPMGLVQATHFTIWFENIPYLT